MLTSSNRLLFVVLVVAMGLTTDGCSDSVSTSDDTQVPLSRLSITPPGALQPSFSSNTTRYSANVPTAATNVTVTASPKDSTTTMEINGTVTASGEGRSVSLGLPGSTTPIQIALTSQTGLESTYTVMVTRLVSSDNELSALRVSAGSLDPTFAPGTESYTVNVSNLTENVTITATKSDPNAVMSGSVTAGIGQSSGEAIIPLGAPGTATPVSITVTAPSGLSKAYAVTINRLASNDANLSNLGVSVGPLNLDLDPAFTQARTEYSVKVGILVGSVTITATKSDPNAQISALGSVIAGAGTATGQVTISPGLGENPPVEIHVIAQDGATQKTYAVTITRSLF